MGEAKTKEILGALHTWMRTPGQREVLSYKCVGALDDMDYRNDPCIFKEFKAVHSDNPWEMACRKPSTLIENLPSVWSPQFFVMGDTVVSNGIMLTRIPVNARPIHTEPKRHKITKGITQLN